MNITTDYWAKPIPTSAFDWSAIDADTYDGAPDTIPACPIGYGATEDAAIADLLDQIEDSGPIGAEDVAQYRQDNGALGVGS